MISKTCGAVPITSDGTTSGLAVAASALDIKPPGMLTSETTCSATVGPVIPNSSSVTSK